MILDGLDKSLLSCNVANPEKQKQSFSLLIQTNI